MKHIFLHCCLHFSIGFSFFIFTWVFFMPLPSGFWLLASAASGFWLLRLLDSLAFGCWLVAFASRRILHVVCWSFGFLPLACARGMKTLWIRVLTSPFRGKNACQDTCWIWAPTMFMSFGLSNGCKTLRRLLVGFYACLWERNWNSFQQVSGLALLSTSVRTSLFPSLKTLVSGHLLDLVCIGFW